MTQAQYTIKALTEALSKGKVSSVELTRDALNAARGDSNNCFISLSEEHALQQAHNADIQIKQKSGSFLTGIPMAHKDIFCTKHSTTTCGSKMLENFAAPYDATVVKKLNDAGMVCIGKTNMDEFAMGSSNESSFFGAVHHPWDFDYVPGGSSGGSAVAVAKGYVPFATGTDTGGSIRQPSAFCGVTGLKPTYGSISRFGMIAFASSLDQAGPIGVSALDVAHLFAFMAGFDKRDSTSAKRQDNWADSVKSKGFTARHTPKKIGLPSGPILNMISYQKEFETARRQIESAGHSFIEVDLPNLEHSVPVYYVLASAEASTNLARYDGVRFGHRCSEPKSLEDLYKRSRGEGFGEEVKRRILTGTYTLSVGYFDDYYVKAQKIRRKIFDDFAATFSKVDAIMLPTTPDTAFKLGSLDEDPVSMYQQDLFTVPASLAGIPALSIPCGFHNDLPVGLQLIGPANSERTILEIACEYQKNTSWHLIRPNSNTVLERF